MAAVELKSDIRSRDRARKNAARAEKTVVVIPKCEDPARRARLESDDVAWLLYYFGDGCELDDPFWYSFTWQQREMIAAIRHAMQYGGDQAFAASRGEGKTTLAERLLLKATLTGEVNYSVLFAATGSLADNSLDSIKTAITDNPLLAADYPEVCVPVIALEGAPQRANTQRVNGFRHDNGRPYEMAETRFSWCGQEVIFPNVPGSPSARAIIATRGLDAAVRGLKKRGKRPKLAIIDDPDTEDTSRSEEQAKKLETRIDSAIGGLGGQQRGIGRVMLTTLQSRIAVSYLYTDPERKPSFKGRRFRFLVKPPERSDLWDEYVQLRRIDLHDRDEEGKLLDPHCRRSHGFYLERRKAMDDGAEVANPHRFNPQILGDGSQSEVSALQRYYNEVARTNAASVATEYDNDPPEEDGPVESGISAGKLQQRLSGFPRRVVPPDCIKLTRGIDLQKAGGHWVVKAWRSDATFYVIDYGFHESHGTTYGSDEGVEFAIRRVILELAEQVQQEPYLKDGQPMPIDVTLVDSGWQAATVYQACAEIGLGIYPAKGHGKSHGCATPNFHDVWTRTRDRKPGDGWFMSRLPGNRWLVHCDTDRWKSFEHARWLTQEGKPGAAYLYGEISDEERRYLEKRMPRDAKDHHGFARHLTAEVEVEETVRGQLKRFWKVKAGRVQNHYLDASYLANVAGSMAGVRLLGETKPSRPPPDQRMSARQMAQAAGRMR